MNRDRLLLHIPHASNFLPSEERSSVLLSDEDLKQELLVMTDWYMDECFDVPCCTRHVHAVSRLVLDPERFREDAEEEMALYGMGAVYTRTSNGRPLRALDAEARESLLSKYYDPYHAALTATVQEKLDRFGQCVILDAHSFPSQALPYERGNPGKRPEICIGFDAFHSGPEWVDRATDYFTRKCGCIVALNTPFAGSMVPRRFYGKDSRVVSLMVEVNRALYMDEKTGKKSPGFDLVRGWAEGFVQSLAEWA